MLVFTPVPALSAILGRFLQVELQSIYLADHVEPLPGLAEGEAELLVAGDRARKIVDQELGSEGCYARLRLASSAYSG